MAMVFRERDGVCIEYEVRGIPGSEKYPYIDHLRTLKEAVAIARTYPEVYADGAATHVVRMYSKRCPNGHKFHHSSGPTHRWRVDSEGLLQLIAYYQHGWRCGKPSCRQDLQAYKAGLPVMPNRATTLRGELLDLASIAERIGLPNASRALVEHSYGRQFLPRFEQKDQGKIEVDSQESTTTSTQAISTHPIWRRIVAKAFGQLTGNRLP